MTFEKQSINDNILSSKPEKKRSKLNRNNEYSNSSVSLSPSTKRIIKRTVSQILSKASKDVLISEKHSLKEEVKMIHKMGVELKIIDDTTIWNTKDNIIKEQLNNSEVNCFSGKTMRKPKLQHKANFPIKLKMENIINSPKSPVILYPVESEFCYSPTKFQKIKFQNNIKENFKVKRKSVVINNKNKTKEKCNNEMIEENIHNLEFKNEINCCSTSQSITQSDINMSKIYIENILKRYQKKKRNSKEHTDIKKLENNESLIKQSEQQLSKEILSEPIFDMDNFATFDRSKAKLLQNKLNIKFNVNKTFINGINRNSIKARLENNDCFKRLSKPNIFSPKHYAYYRKLKEDSINIDK